MYAIPILTVYSFVYQWGSIIKTILVWLVILQASVFTIIIINHVLEDD